MATNRNPVRFYHLSYFATSKNTLCIARTRIYCEKKEFSPNYFRRAVRWGVFLFSPCVSTCTSSTYVRVSCRERLFVARASRERHDVWVRQIFVFFNNLPSRSPVPLACVGSFFSISSSKLRIISTPNQYPPYP